MYLFLLTFRPKIQDYQRESTSSMEKDSEKIDWTLLPLDDSTIDEILAELIVQVVFF